MYIIILFYRWRDEAHTQGYTAYVVSFKTHNSSTNRYLCNVLNITFIVVKCVEKWTHRQGLGVLTDTALVEET